MVVSRDRAGSFNWPNERRESVLGVGPANGISSGTVHVLNFILPNSAQRRPIIGRPSLHASRRGSAVQATAEGKDPNAARRAFFESVRGQQLRTAFCFPRRAILSCSRPSCHILRVDEPGSYTSLAPPEHVLHIVH